MESLAGKVAIVTGASRGIGATTAFALGEAGASVILAARNTAQTDVNAQRINAAGGKAAAIACDVSDYAACQRLVRETSQRFGPPDVLINRFTTEPETKPVPVITKESPTRIGEVTPVMVGGKVVLGEIAAIAATAQAINTSSVNTTFWDSRIQLPFCRQGIKTRP